MKNKKTCFPRKAAWLFALLLWPLTARTADTMVVFGLTNQSINGTALSVLDFGRLHVDALSYLGYKGLSVRLGEAESGLFFKPQVSGYGFLEDTNFMTAHAYGRVSGLDRRICSVFGRRERYGVYPVTVDFTPLAAFAQTFQVYCDGMLVREETNTVGAVIFDTSNDGNLYPRVNPFWRARDGSVGVLIEINRSIVTLPGGTRAYGNRVFIKPERSLFIADYVSRVEVFGGGGLPNFEAWGESLGVFNLPHTALGSAVFTAKRRELTVGGLGANPDDGVMVELDGASSYEMRLRPLALPTNAMVQISALGLEFIGPVGLRNTGETVEVFGLFGASSTNRVRIGVFDNGVLVGGATNEGGVFGTIPPGVWRVAACGALPESGSDRSSVYLTLDRPVVFQRASGGAPLTGNQLRFSWQGPGPDNGSFRNFQMQAAGVPSFSITNGVTTPAPAQLVSIEAAGDQVQVSWPYGSTYTFLEVGYATNGTYLYSYVPGAQVVGSRWQVSLPITANAHQLFRLNSYCNFLNAYLNGGN